MQENKLTKLVIKLMRQTIAKEIKWEVSDAPNYLTDGTDHKIPIFFTTKFNDKTFALFQRRYQNYSLEFDVMYWAEEIKLAIIENKKILWENKENILALSDLLKSVEEQVSGLDEILDSIL